MAKVAITVCDLCGEGGASTYDVTHEDHGSWQVDLCDRCASPLLANKPRQGHRFKKIPLPPQPS